MAIKPLLSIGGVGLPAPSSYVGLTSDVVDAGRNVLGYAIGGVVREDMAKVEASWNILTPKEWSDILKLFNSNYGGGFYRKVTFYNQTTADWETRTMYPGDRTTSGAIAPLDPNTGAPTGWQSPVLHLVEQ